MPVLVTAAQLDYDPDDDDGVGPVLRLTYRVPGNRDHDRDGAHQHAVPLRALLTRAALYGHDDALDALEECVREVLVLHSGTDPLGAKGGHAVRAASRRAQPVNGLSNALRKAGIQLPPVAGTPELEEEQRQLQEQQLRQLGRDKLANLRGVPASSLPDPGKWHPNQGPLLPAKLPKAARVTTATT